MTVRKYSAGLAASALLASGLALTAMAPAMADPIGFTPSATDIVGVGSDTIEFVVGDLAAGKTVDGTAVAGWNATHPNQRIASFNATPQPSTILLRTGGTAVTRPNGSGQGKATLFGAGNNADVNFARSSSTLSTAEQAALTQFPFAVDGLKIAVSGTTSTNAPASLTINQIVDIYKGTYKKWSDIDPTFSGDFIHPLIPQAGSGTRSFFEAELKAANGGVAVTYPAAGGGYSGVVEVQEHNPNQIQGDPDAIAPFSTARAQTLANPAAIKFEPGYAAKRAVYDVVRNADAGSQWAQDIFGSTGFFCSAAAKPIIEANGFAQLASVANGGVCGVGVTAPVSNFATNTVATTTSLAATSPAGRSVKLTATVDAGDQNADGDVNFYEGTTKVGSGLLSGGVATKTLTSVTPGVHSYTAEFVTANAASFTGSVSAPATSVTVKEKSTTSAVVTAKSYGHASTAKVTVAAGSAQGVGNVTVKVGSTVIGTKALSAGAATFTLPSTLTAGAKTLTATYAGNGETAGSTGTKAFTVAKSAVTLKESFPSTVAKGKKGVGTVTVALSPTSSVKPTGTITIKLGSKVVGKGTLVKGVVKITLSKLAKGKHTLVATYGGSANSASKTLKIVVTQK
ncbi:MAG: hypothetical protein JWQ74_1718 [Marmoricola sp.]|nr:hypothetical protein [Marmoricola sp.]